MMPMPPTSMRWYLPRKPEAALASTYGTGTSTSSMMPISCTSPPCFLMA